MSLDDTEPRRTRERGIDPRATRQDFEDRLGGLLDAVVVFEPLRNEAGVVDDARVLYWNKAAGRMLRAGAVYGDTTGRTLRELNPAALDIIMDSLRATAAGRAQVTPMDTETGAFPNATWQHGRALWFPLRFGMIIVILQDVTEEFVAKADVERAGMFRRAIVDTIRDPLIVWQRQDDGSTLAVEANPAAARWLKDPTPCEPASLMIDSAHIEQLRTDLGRVICTNNIVQRTVALDTDNVTDPLAARLVHSPLPGSMVFTQFIDVTEELRQSLELARRLRLDDDTGLLNRIGFEDALSDLLSAGNDHLIILAVQFDHLESVEQRLGLTAVAEVLTTIANVLRELVPNALALGRVAYGTFAVVVAAGDPRRRWQRIAPSIDDRFAMPVAAAGLQLHLGASIGIARSEAGDAAAALLLRRARLAAGDARSRSHSTAEWDEAMEDRHPERIEILGEVSRAIDKNEFIMLFQPKIDLEGRLHGAEALVRWRHPTKGMISPGDYIELVEESTLVSRFTKVTLRTALITWHRSGLPGRVAVNLPASMLSDPELCDIVDEAVVSTVCPTSKVTLEITERGVLESNPQVDRNIETLRSRGIAVSIDDFGTGGSSLTYLRRVALDEVKIDRQFISDLSGDAVNRAIVAAVVGIARTLGFSVVAEGVETAAELSAARELGCTLFQGFGICRPAPLTDLLALMGPDGRLRTPDS